MPEPRPPSSDIQASLGLYDLALTDETRLSDAEPQHQLSTDEPGQIIAGRYVLKSLLGEGGTGHVWCAEQTQPVRRDVALKIIRAGLVAQPVSARFNREHHVLARMEHPNIAAVFDAGELPDGRAYFVMEVISGLPITSWCRQHRPALAQRLEIFIQACHAVHHAHQKGILHRDLKPSNVMVTLRDGQPLVKVIDFGIAKALEGDLRLGADVTLRGTVLGTPRYMSPEQAGLTGQDVDTRADVYALGVLLYELLTQSTPIQDNDEQDATLPELLHQVRHTEIELPSRRVMHRPNPDEAALPARELRGDLDWIVLRALQKDRERRYPTVLSLAEDLRRSLRDEPVDAGPPGMAYRLKKAFLRHRHGIAAAAAVLLSLGGGVAATLWALEREEVQKREVEKQKESIRKQTDLARQVGDQLQELLTHARRHAESGKNTQTLRHLADDCAAGMTRFADQPQAEAPLAEHLAELYLALQEPARAQPWLQRRWALLQGLHGELSPLALKARHRLGNLCLTLNQRESAVSHLRAAVQGMDQLADAALAKQARMARVDLARALSRNGQHAEALALFAEVIPQADAQDPRQQALWLREQAEAFRSAGRLPEASAALQRALARLPQDRGHIDLRAYILGSLASTSQLPEHYVEALAASAENLEQIESELGPEHPRLLTALIDHALKSCKVPDCPGGEEAARRALRLAQKAGHESRLAEAWVALSETLRMKRRFAESEQALRDAMTELSQIQTEPWRLLELRRRLGDLLVARGRFEEALEEYESAAAQWFTPPIVGRTLEKERLIFESFIAFWKQAAAAQSPIADDAQLAHWESKLRAWEAAQPAVPGARRTPSVNVP